MLNITNPTIVTQNSLQNPSESALFLRVNQHIAGEVISVENEQVVLSIQGVQIVARMTTPEQTATLIERRFAQFVVKEMSGEVLTLQLVDPKASNGTLAATRPETQLVSKLLTQLGLPDGPGTQLIAQAAIRNSLTINQSLLNELGSALNPIINWGMQHALAAASLKANGIPVSPQSISLMLNTPENISGQIQNLIQQLSRALADNRLPPNMIELARSSLHTLRQAVIDASLPAAELSAKLHNAITLLGKSVENELMESMQKSRSSLPADNLERGLMVLNKLRNDLADRGMKALAEGIDEFNDSVRMMHLYHSASTKEAKANQWIRMELPVNFPTYVKLENRDPNDQNSASIRIARNPEEDGLSVNPRYTRLVIRMDVGEKEVIEVDLSVVDHATGLSISTSDSQLTKLAKSELPTLQKELSQIGYETLVSQVETDYKLSNPDNEIQRSHQNLITGINVEV